MDKKMLWAPPCAHAVAALPVNHEMFWIGG